MEEKEEEIEGKIELSAVRKELSVVRKGLLEEKVYYNFCPIAEKEYMAVEERETEKGILVGKGEKFFGVIEVEAVSRGAEEMGKKGLLEEIPTVFFAEGMCKGGE